jgi:hypothetical protein
LVWEGGFCGERRGNFGREGGRKLAPR